jgi:hypothetical protein
MFCFDCFELCGGYTTNLFQQLSVELLFLIEVYHFRFLALDLVIQALGVLEGVFVWLDTLFFEITI